MNGLDPDADAVRFDDGRAKISGRDARTRACLSQCCDKQVSCLDSVLLEPLEMVLGDVGFRIDKNPVSDIRQPNDSRPNLSVVFRFQVRAEGTVSNGGRLISSYIRHGQPTPARPQVSSWCTTHAISAP